MKRFVGCLALAGAMSLQAGCSTINPYTGEKQTSKAGMGAGIGAVTGALIGIATSDSAKERKERALKGAGIGAVAGGGVGYYMDVQEAKLHAVSEVLNEYKSTMIQVAGHTDSTGGDKYNLMLSQQRAQSVANILGGFGVEQVRMDTVGFGETQPIASNGTASGREQNRRVELTLLPYTE